MKLYALLAVLVLACSGCTKPVHDSGPAVETPVENTGSSPDFPCTLPGGDTQTFTSLETMAPEIRQQFGRMAPRDGNFNISDAIGPGQENWPFTRFIQGGRSGTRWYVWYEYGGIAYGIEAKIIDLPVRDHTPRLILRGAPGKDICQFTIQHLNDRPHPLDEIVQ